MTKVNLLLLAVLVLCALSLVTSRHQSRRLFVELTRAQTEARGYETEFGQLQLEQSTWGMPARVEKVAREQLRMQLPTAARTEVVPMPKAEAGASATAERSGGGAARASLVRPTAADTCCLAAANPAKEAAR